MPSPVVSYPPVLLASSSKYRASLLKKLGLSFIQVSPNIDESRVKSETPNKMVARLSQQKAFALSNLYSEHIIIASDQLAVTQNNDILGKPTNTENAIEQLSQVSGQKVKFLTGLCVLAPQSQTNTKASIQTIVEPYNVYFRELSHAQIRDYISREQPLDCAGSFKSEGLGISLFEKLEGDDPNALVGLPLIKLCTMLANIGVPVLAKA
jgi:MAF protein